MRFYKARIGFIIIIVLILIFNFYYFSIKAFSQEKDEKNINEKGKEESVIDNEYIVTFDNDNSKNKFTNRHKKEIIKEKKIDDNVYLFAANKKITNPTLGAATFLRLDPGVITFEPNHKMQAFVTPNDTNYGSQWHLPKIQSPAGWDVTQGLNTTVIAVIDTGVQLNHPDLDDKIWNNPDETGMTQDGDFCWTGAPADKSTNNCDDDQNGYIDDWRGWDWVNNDNNPTDDEGHGTSVSGIAAAETNNAQGVAGVNWQAKIMVLKMLDDEGFGDEADLISAINYARIEGAKIINMSLGGDGYTAPLKTAVDNAVNAGMVLVASSGNVPYCTQYGNIGVNWPAAFSNVIAVGSTKNTDYISSFSCSGPEVDVAAPGENIYTTELGSTYGNAGSGTSFAAPQVAGLAGLILAKDNDATPAEVRNYIIHGASKTSYMGSVEYSIYYGYGRINIPASYYKLIKTASSPAIYGIFMGYKHHIRSTNAYVYYGVTAQDLETISSTIFNAIPTGYASGYLTKGSSSEIYLFSAGQKYYIPSYTLMQQWGYDWTNIEVVPDEVIYKYPSYQNLQMLFKGLGAPVYAAVGWGGAHINAMDVWNNWHFSWNAINQLDETTLVQIPIYNQDLGRIVNGSGPNIYLIENCTKRHIQSLSTYLGMIGYYGSSLTIYDGLLNFIPNGPPIP